MPMTDGECGQCAGGHSVFTGCLPRDEKTCPECKGKGYHAGRKQESWGKTYDCEYTCNTCDGNGMVPA